MNNTITLRASHLYFFLIIFLGVGGAGRDHGEGRTGRLYIKEVKDLCLIWSARGWWRKLYHYTEFKVEPPTALHSLLALFVFVTAWGSPSICLDRTDTVMEVKNMPDFSFMSTYLLCIILIGCIYIRKEYFTTFAKVTVAEFYAHAMACPQLRLPLLFGRVSITGKYHFYSDLIQ